jgi:hypothetical protein
MPATSIKALRRTTGQTSGSEWTVDVHYRVVMDDSTDGPVEVLRYFPVGQPIINYDKNIDPSDPGNYYVPPWYLFPYPLTGCQGTTYTSTYSDFNFILTSASIVSRELGNKSPDTWIVAARYTYRTDLGAKSVPTVVPYYIKEEENQEYGGWCGPYKREFLSAVDNDRTQPGKWVEKDLPTRGTFKDLVVSRDNGAVFFSAVLPITNSAGETPQTPLVQKIARPAYRVSWFSYTALDFTKAIGRVNRDVYTLAAFDHYETKKTDDNYRRGYTIFRKRFCARQLLVADVQCDLVNWGNRNNYKYTVDLIYDEDGHDRWVIDSGFVADATVGSLSGRGDEYTAEDQSDGANPVQQISGNDGLPARTETLLNGEGGVLRKENSDGSTEVGTADAVYHRWRIYEEVDFPKDSTDPENQYHQYDPKAAFPLLMDGGYRYFVENEFPWGNPEDFKCPGDAQDPESPWSL